MQSRQLNSDSHTKTYSHACSKAGCRVCTRSSLRSHAACAQLCLTPPCQHNTQNGATALVIHQIDLASRTSIPLLCLDSVCCLLHLSVPTAGPADRASAPTPHQPPSAALLGISGEGGLFVLDFARWRPDAAASGEVSRLSMSHYAVDVRDKYSGPDRQSAVMAAFRAKFFALHPPSPAIPHPHASFGIRAPQLVTCALWIPGAWCAKLGVWSWKGVEGARDVRDVAPGMSSGGQGFRGGMWEASWLLVVAMEGRDICVLQTQRSAAGGAAPHVHGDGDTAMDDTPEDSRVELIKVGMTTCGIVATHMLALGNGRLLISGDDGDSKAMRLLHCPDGATQESSARGDLGGGEEASAWLLEEEASVPQFGATADFAIVSHGAECAGEDLDLVLCSGLGSQASLRRVRSGVRVETHIQSEPGQYDGVTGLWAIASPRWLRWLQGEKGDGKLDDDGQDAVPDMGSLLVMSFTNSCRVYTVHSELRDVTEDVGLNPGAATLYAAAARSGVLVQVMEREILFVSKDLGLDTHMPMQADGACAASGGASGGAGGSATWQAPLGSDISVATASGNLVLCSTSSERMLHLIDTTNVCEVSGSFAIRGKILSFRSVAEASSLALIGLGGAATGARCTAEEPGVGGQERWLAILGTYGDVHAATPAALHVMRLDVDTKLGTAVVTPLQVLDLSAYSAGDVAGSVAQSLTSMQGADQQQRLLVGLRNGRVVNYRIAPEQADVLCDATLRRLAESPVSFVKVASPTGPALVGLLQDRTLFLRPSRWSLAYQRISLQGEVASHVAPFCCAACPYGLAVLVDSQLRIVSLDETQGLDVTCVPLAPLGGAREFPLRLLPQLATPSDDLHHLRNLLTQPHTIVADSPAPPAPSGADFELFDLGGDMRSGAADGEEDVGMGIGVRDDFMASRVVWLAHCQCVLVACNYFGQQRSGGGWEGGLPPGCEIRLVDMTQGSEHVVETMFLGKDERVYCISLVTSRDGELLVCVGTGRFVVVCAHAHTQPECSRARALRGHARRAQPFGVHLCLRTY